VNRPEPDAGPDREIAAEARLGQTCGRIVFHTADGDIELGPGNKMVLPPYTAHTATVGAKGMRCIEASRRPDSSQAE